MPLDGEQQILWEFPVGGVSSNYAHADQPANTSPDCLNVLPYDLRTGRARGGCRPGTGRLHAAPLSASAVTAFHTVRRPLSGINPQPEDVLYDTAFAATPVGGKLAVAEAATWRVDYLAIPGYADSAKLVGKAGGGGIEGVKLPAGGGTFGAEKYAVYVPTLTLGRRFTLRATVRASDATLPSTQADGDYSHPGTGGITVNERVNGLVWAYDGNDASPHMLVAEMNEGYCRVLARVKESGSINTVPLGYFQFAPALADAQHALEVRVDGTNVKLLVDGVQRIEANVATPALTAAQLASVTGPANARVGFFTSTISGESTLPGTLPGVYAWSASASGSLANYTEVLTLAAAGADLYAGAPSAMALLNGGAALVDPQSRPALATLDGFGYVVDGTGRPRRIDLASRSVVPFAETAGVAPADCRAACSWRGRLVLAGDGANPQNFYMSAAGDALNWDYGAGGPATAVAGNAAAGGVGRIGEPIQALIPFQDDQLVIGCDRSTYVVRGDLADGGSIDFLSTAVGVAGPTAWTRDPSGNVYFVGTGGFYRIDAGGGAVGESLARGKLDSFFKAIDFGNHYVTCVWDSDRQGCWIFVTRVNTGQSDHLWYDARTEGFFPQRFPDAQGPVAAAWYGGESENERYVLLGGRDGFIRSTNVVNRRDDGVTIPQHVFLTPRVPSGDLLETKALGVDVVGGELRVGDDPSSWNLNVYLQAADDVLAAVAAPARTFGFNLPDPGRRPLRRCRLRGVAFAVLVENANDGDYFSFERIVVRTLPGGRSRP